MMTNLMTILERKVFISSNPRIVLSSCPPPCGHFSIQESATGGLSYKVKKELQDLGVTKIPSSEKIQKRIENLESEQAATIREKQKLQKKQKTLDIIQQNFSVLLDAPEINSDLLPAKREPVSVTRDK